VYIPYLEEHWLFSFLYLDKMSSSLQIMDSPLCIFWILIWFIVFYATFSYIMVSSFSGGRSRSTRREPPTMGKQLVNFITGGCKSSAPFL
jgi:hypothetical protein